MRKSLLIGLCALVLTTPAAVAAAPSHPKGPSLSYGRANHANTGALVGVVVGGVGGGLLGLAAGAAVDTDCGRGCPPTTPIAGAMLGAAAGALVGGAVGTVVGLAIPSRGHRPPVKQRLGVGVAPLSHSGFTGAVTVRF